jgi:hypothetical protein
MTANPLKNAKTVSKGSVYTAAEYAARAEANGDKVKAKQWWEAQRNGWDEENYDPVAASDHKRKIIEARKAWGGGNG